jgi:hypothetical protein
MTMILERTLSKKMIKLAQMSLRGRMSKRKRISKSMITKLVRNLPTEMSLDPWIILLNLS